MKKYLLILLFYPFLVDAQIIDTTVFRIQTGTGSTSDVKVVTVADATVPLSTDSLFALNTTTRRKVLLAPGDLKINLALNNVDNTTDANKPVSTAQQTALNLKANLASPTFTGTVVLPSGQALVAPVLGTPTSGNFSTGSFTWPTFNQSTTGSAATLTTTRTIWGQNFNGSANVTGTLALSTSDITMSGSIGVTGTRVTKVWTTDIESTNMYTVGGTSLSSTFSPIAGSASIVTVGTVTSGTWNGTVINQAFLGSGGGGSTKFLREDNTWQTVSGSGGQTFQQVLATAIMKF